MRLPITALVVVLALAAAVHAADTSVTAKVTTCFSPGPARSAEQIADAIDAARSKVRVQAYWLTSVPILRAIAGAKRRGLDVAAILDRTQDRRNSTRSHYSGATYLWNAGIPVWIDDAPAIAHNKVIVLDDQVVITGSFNFSKAADTRNAENVVILDSAAVASQFTRNWEERRSASRLFEAE